MALTRSLAAYYDVAQILATARRNGGARYRLLDDKAAIRWRARAYYYRSLLARMDELSHPEQPGYMPSTQWDDLHLSLEGPTVVIAFNVLAGALTTLNGESISTTKHAPEAAEAPVSSLLQLATQLASDKGE